MPRESGIGASDMNSRMNTGMGGMLPQGQSGTMMGMQ